MRQTQQSTHFQPLWPSCKSHHPLSWIWAQSVASVKQVFTHKWSFLEAINYTAEQSSNIFVILFIKIYYETKAFLYLAFIHNAEDFTPQPWTISNQAQPFDYTNKHQCNETVLVLWILVFVDIYRGLVSTSRCLSHKYCVVSITRYAYEYLPSLLEYKSEYWVWV